MYKVVKQEKKGKVFYQIRRPDGNYVNDIIFESKAEAENYLSRLIELGYAKG